MPITVKITAPCITKQDVVSAIISAFTVFPIKVQVTNTSKNHDSFPDLKGVVVPIIDPNTGYYTKSKIISLGSASDALALANNVSTIAKNSSESGTLFVINDMPSGAIVDTWIGVSDAEFQETETITPRATLADLTNTDVERVGKVLYVDGVAVGGNAAIKNLNIKNYTQLANSIRKTIIGLSNTRILFVGDSTTTGTGGNPLGNNLVAHSHTKRFTDGLIAIGINASNQSYYGTDRLGSGLNVVPITLSDNRVSIGVKTDISALVSGSNYVITTLGTGNWLSIGATKLLVGEMFIKNSVAYSGTGSANEYTLNHKDSMQGWQHFSTGIGGGLITNNSTVSPITFTPTIKTDTLIVYYLDNSGYDPFTVKVGAGVIGTATISGSSSIKSLVAKTGNLAELNTYTIQRSGNGGNLIIVGFEAIDSAKKEVSIINAGQGGSFLTTSFALASTSYWNSLSAITAGAAKFDAVVIDFGINHWDNYKTSNPNLFETAMNLAVSTITAAAIPIILVAPQVVPVTTGPDSPAIATQQLYIDAIYRTAATYGLAVIDLFNTWGTYSDINSNGWNGYNGDVHPSAVGYQVKSAYFTDFIQQIIK